MSGETGQIKFPCRWEFRLIAGNESLEKTRAAVAEIGKREHADFEVTDGDLSPGGRYAALRVSCEVDSRERATALAAALSRADGVRFLI